MIVKIVLNLQDTTDAKIIIDGRYYIVSITDNPYFSAADIIAFLVVLEASIANLQTKMSVVTSDSKTDDIKVARDAVDRNLNILASKVENTVNAPEVPDIERLARAHSAGMNVKGYTHPADRTFKAENADVSGTVNLSAKGMALAHVWKYTADIVNFTNFQEIEPTSEANTTVSGLTKKTEYAFFHKPVISKVVSPWEGPEFVVIT